MGIGKVAQNLFEKLGTNNKAVYAVVGIAVAKGICRPISTMRDKKQDPESRKYAAFREGLTEGIAIPTYLLSDIVASKIAPNLVAKKLVTYDPKDGTAPLKLTKELKNKFKGILNIRNGINKKLRNEEILNECFENAVGKLEKNEKGLFDSYVSKLKIVKETTPFIAVCIAAVVVIPGLCNVFLPPLMNKIKSIQESKKLKADIENITQNVSKPLDNVQKPNPVNPVSPVNSNSTNLLNNSYSGYKSNSGMKVGA